MENDFGCVPAKWKARLRFSRGKDRITFGKMSIQYCQLIEPALTVVDAIVAMDGMGPRGGNPYPLGILTGGVDVVALDRVHSEKIGLPMSGIFSSGIVHTRSSNVSIGACVRDLEIIVKALESADWVNEVQHLPL